ncbi:selenide, water dikinase SelD [Desulfopila aestuarii]|uniref:selenide, water dikinase SelD n=1 Tax=Desulfopila aestuarii TaxID=231440 RepID=UPI001161457F|nr:selenide, water dikinase SelD [Desulfopila aestuarii]
MGPTDLSDALAGFEKPEDPDLLVGIETSDDAAVYRLSDDIAMINTVDFITPPVDDPYWFGQISAANSISDVYSMGGRPVTALNVVMFPSKHLDMGVLREILKGGHDKVIEAGACLVGGHSVDDNEPKYGLCVNGVVHPDRVITNAGAKPGDALVLTKPLGSGVLFNAVRAGKFEFKVLERETLPIIASLNGTAMQLALKYELHACTDVTGFGILGHSLEMALGCSKHIHIEYQALPFYSGAYEMYKRGETTGSNVANRALVARHTLVLSRTLTKEQEELLYDPQTSGGLLIALPADQAGELINEMHSAGLGVAVRIGEVTDEAVGLTVR